MKQISLIGKNGIGKFALVDDEDYEALKLIKWYGKTGLHTFYAETYMFNKTIPMHRFLMNPSKGMIVDHANRDGLDNRKSNLRICTISENLRNRQACGKSKYLGVYLHTRRFVYVNKKGETKTGETIRWNVCISLNKKSVYLGSFIEEEDAAKCYDEAAKKHWGEFANLNFK